MPEVHPFELPAPPGSAQPYVESSGHNIFFLSWIGPGTQTEHQLQAARLSNRQWSHPTTIATGDKWFVNWADFPSITISDRQISAAHWLAKKEGSPYAYHVQIARRDPATGQWGTPLTPHDDRSPTEHGFVSMVPLDKDRLLAVWLDGRQMAGSNHATTDASAAMTLRAAVIASDGTIQQRWLLDDRVCDCCQTSAVRTEEGVVVAYRNRTQKEIRDISVVRFDGDRWSDPVTVHDDGWEIGGCPVNGPQLAAGMSSVAVAWYTKADDQPRVNVAFSDDNGQSFGQPIRIDDGQPLGRVDVVMDSMGRAWTSWVERSDDDAEIRLQASVPNGTLGSSTAIAPISASRSSGFPRMALSGPKILMAWTHIENDNTRLKAAMVDL